MFMLSVLEPRRQARVVLHLQEQLSDPTGNPPLVCSTDMSSYMMGMWLLTSPDVKASRMASKVPALVKYGLQGHFFCVRDAAPAIMDMPRVSCPSPRRHTG